MVWRKVYISKITKLITWRRSLSYKNQSIDLSCKSMDWFLYGNHPRHERVKLTLALLVTTQSNLLKDICLIPISSQYRSFHRSYSMEKVFLFFFFFCKIHRETPVPKSLFYKVAGLSPATLLKMRSGTVVFRWILRNF